jgi:hypothetical protein
MLAAVAAHNIFRDWLTYISIVVGICLTAGTLYIRVIYPRSQQHKIHEKERQNLRQQLDDKDKLHNGFLDGVEEVPGMTSAVEPAAVRVRILEEWMWAQIDEKG